MSTSVDVLSHLCLTAWQGFDLSSFTTLKDTDTLHKTKALGVRLADTDFVELVQPIRVLEVDFHTTNIKDLLPTDAATAQHFDVRVTRAGIIHAAVAYFDLFIDKGRKHVVSTHPQKSSFVRDMQWGQGIQALEDWRFVQRDIAAGDETPRKPRKPHPLVVEEGDLLKVDVYYAPGRGRHMSLRVSSYPKEVAYEDCEGDNA